MALDLTMIQGMGLEEILLWVLSFAVVFGILSQVGSKGLPESKPIRGIISIVIAFFALFAAAGTGLIDVISGMSVGLLLIIIAIVVFIVFLETAGVRTSKFKKDKEGTIIKTQGESILKQHPMVFAAILVVIAAIIFISAGGLDLLGFTGGASLGETNIMSLMFFGIIALAIIWLIANPD
ncbi:MAG: hypothetical protein ISS95_01085 [Candidatus Aenigmarchaeota archaeon]|nr:hypothetical protein [Candidatus Aenigmarchaeota archaeon]